MSRFNPIKIEDTESESEDEYGVVDDAVFPLNITKSQAKGKQPKAIPMKFLKGFLLPQKPKSVVLVDEEGIETECHLLWKNTGENVCYLRMGWYEFVKTHRLKGTDWLLAIPSRDGRVLHIVVHNGVA